MLASVLWQNAVVLQRLTERKEWKFFAVLPKADLGLAAVWWTTLLMRGILPGGVRDRYGRARRRGATRGSSCWSPRHWRRDLCSASGAQPHSSSDLLHHINFNPN